MIVVASNFTLAMLSVNTVELDGSARVNFDATYIVISLANISKSIGRRISL